MFSDYIGCSITEIEDFIQSKPNSWHSLCYKVGCCGTNPHLDCCTSCFALLCRSKLGVEDFEGLSFELRTEFLQENAITVIVQYTVPVTVLLF